jgi:hypothetical protein
MTTSVHIRQISKDQVNPAQPWLPGQLLDIQGIAEPSPVQIAIATAILQSAINYIGTYHAAHPDEPHPFDRPAKPNEKWFPGTVRPFPASVVTLIELATARGWRPDDETLVRTLDYDPIEFMAKRKRVAKNIKYLN